MAARANTAGRRADAGSRRGWRLALAGAVLALPAVVAAIDLQDDADLLQLSRSVLRVEARLPQGGFSLGSGVVVGPDRVITNCHVTGASRSVAVVQGGVRQPATALAAAPAHDLCLLKVPTLESTPAQLGDAGALRVGMPLAAMGFTGGFGLPRSRGEVLSLHLHDGAPVIRSSTWFNSGASGGALFGPDGALVGLLTFRLRGGLAHYYAAPAEWIRALDARAEAGAWGPVEPLAGAEPAYWQQPEAAQPRFLRAATLSQRGQWPQAIALARAWMHDDPTEAEAWRLLGTALSRQSLPVRAQQALACARALDRQHGRLPRVDAAADPAQLQRPARPLQLGAPMPLAAAPAPRRGVAATETDTPAETPCPVAL